MSIPQPIPMTKEVFDSMTYMKRRAYKHSIVGQLELEALLKTLRNKAGTNYTNASTYWTPEEVVAFEALLKRDFKLVKMQQNFKNKTKAQIIDKLKYYGSYN